MPSQLTQNALSGRAIGSLFFTLFGTIWILLSLIASQRLNAAAITILCFVAASLLSAAAALFRKAQKFPRVDDDPRVKRTFNRVNLIQWIAIIAAVLLCSNLHRPEIIPSLISAIVGLHLYPLARLFHSRLHYATGTLLTLWGMASIFMIPTATLQSTTALATGLILWISAAITLYLAHNAAHARSNTLVA